MTKMIGKSSTKMIWTVQNHFGPIEGQGIIHLIHYYAFSSSIGTTLITEGETSYPFYFSTLPTTPPTPSLPCVVTRDSITFKWTKPSTGMVDGTVYQYGYSLSQVKSGMAQGMINLNFCAHLARLLNFSRSCFALDQLN